MEIDKQPALMVSFVYLDLFLKARVNYHYRDWSLDSGAFSAWNRGVTIDLNHYIETCLSLKEKDKKLVEIFSLDVIGGKRAGISLGKAAELSLKNTEKLWDAGVEAIPVYHIGEPIKFLEHLAKTYPKIGLGGMKTRRLSPKGRLNWCLECFARIWPKKIHGFAIGNRTVLMGVPFHSVDASSWELRPTKYGSWPSFGNTRLGIRGDAHNLRPEVEHYLKLEREMQSRWKKEMELIDPKSIKKRPDIKLVTFDQPGFEKRHLKAFGVSNKPQIRRKK